MARIDGDDDESSLGRKLGLAAAAVVLGGGIFFAVTALRSGSGAPPKQTIPAVVQIKMLQPPPPPPPPPPPKVTPPEPQKVVDTPKMQEPMKIQHTPSPPRLNAPPAGPIGSSSHGAGPAVGSGDGTGGDGDGLGGDGTLQGWFGGVVQTAIYQAVSGDERINHAEGEVVANICLAADGTASNVTILTPFPDESVNAALKDDILSQLRLSDPPPQDLPHADCVKFRMRLQASGG